MESKQPSKINNLLKKISLYEEDLPSSASSSSTKDNKEDIKQEKGEPIDEKYFFVKLKHLLVVPKRYSFCNVEIDFKEFMKDLKTCIDEVIKEKNLNIKEFEKIKEDFEKALENESKLELDSLYLNVPGNNIKKFINSTNEYSFPSQYNNISKEKNYTVIVESTHSLLSTIRKKTHQLKKYYMFFSLLYKYFNDYWKYLNKFHDYFVAKYIYGMKKIPEGYRPDFIILQNIVLLIVTDNKFNIFRDMKNKIESSEDQDTNVKKNFPGSFDTKNYIDDTKEDTIIEKDSDSKIKTDKSTPDDRIKKMSYLIKKINQQENWVAKVVYLDVNLNLIVQKTDIADDLKDIKTEIQYLKERINILETNKSGKSEEEGKKEMENNQKEIEIIKKLGKQNEEKSEKKNILEIESIHKIFIKQEKKK